VPDPEQTGAEEGHTLTQLPQLAARVMSVSQPSSALPVQWAQPGAQAKAEKEHCPEASHETAPATCGRTVQSWAQVPQWCAS
jgi:hypothetical protein